MALKKQQKTEIVAALSDLFSSSKMTAVAQYRGLTVKAMQDLRKSARDNGTVIKVVKNRLVKKALEQTDILKAVDTNDLKDQLLYAFNASDETTAAQTLHTFAKSSPELKLVCGFSGDGSYLAEADITAIATLPTKEQLRGQLAGTLAAPLSGFVGVLSGNLRSFAYVLQARADSIK